MSFRTTAVEQQLTIPLDAYIARAGQPEELSSIKGDDSVVAIFDGDGVVQALFAQPQTNSYSVEGTADGAALSEQVLQLRVGEKRVVVPLTAPGLTLTRNGQAAHLGDLHSDDRVVVHFDAGGNPIAVEAVDAGSLPGIAGWWSWLPRWWIRCSSYSCCSRRYRSFLNRRRERQRLATPDDETAYIQEQDPQPSGEADRSVP